MKQLVLGFDLDAIIIDLLRPWIGWYNLEHDDKVSVDDIKTYDIENHTPKTQNVFKFFEEVERYGNCPVLPGAAEGLLELKEAGHDIIVATATAGQTANLKWHLVQKAAPWFKDGNVMVGSRKERLWFDVFCDDAPKNIVKYRNTWPIAHIMTISYPYNQDVKTIVDCFAEDHNDTAKAWRTMVDYIHEVADGRHR